MSPTGHLTRLVEFTATHHVRRPDWTPEANAREFGKAAHSHSHRYQVRVTVKGQTISLGALDKLLAEEITGRFDGRDINADIPEFTDGGLLATGEALAVYMWGRLAPRMPPGVELHAVRVQEGPTLYSEYFGEP